VTALQVPEAPDTVDAHDAPDPARWRATALSWLFARETVAHRGLVLGGYYLLACACLVLAFPDWLTGRARSQGDLTLNPTLWWVNTSFGNVPQLALPLIVLSVLALIALPQYPRLVGIGSGVLILVAELVGVPMGLTTVIFALTVLFGLTAWGSSRLLGLVAVGVSLVATLTAIVALVFRIHYLPPGELPTFNAVLAAVADPRTAALANSSAILILVWAFADQLRAARERQLLKEASQRHAAESAAHREEVQQARGKVEALTDRQRIAREMHDVVAHGLSVMIVQADGARYAAADDPDAATTALATIAATGRSSLAEMRRLLSLLRDEADEVSEAPQPGLADIEGLVSGLRDTGRTIHLDISGDLAPLLADLSLGLTAYRIVQEALTNVMKHAGDNAQAWVAVSATPSGVVIEVSDDGLGQLPHLHPATDDAFPAGGHGLRGMRERVEIVNGTLLSGPAPRGGWRVLATLPLAGATAATSIADAAQTA